MADSELLAARQASLGEAAVDGLLAGIGAGAAMAAYLVLAGLLMGEAPGVMLGRFDPASGGRRCRAPWPTWRQPVYTVRCSASRGGRCEVFGRGCPG